MANFTLPAATVTKVFDSSDEDDLIRLKNTGTNPAEVSKDPGVTTGLGYPVAAGVEETFDVQAGEQLFALSALGTTIAVL